MRTQRGAALLLALLTVALVATFAAASLWQQWRAVEVESSERARIQSAWILTGGLDWARLLLREDLGSASVSSVDHLGEPWAVPLKEARLSEFLAADRNNTVSDFGPEVMDAFLSGQMIDLQSLMNLNNLVNANGSPNDEQKEAFARLFEILGLPASELDKLAEQLRYSIWAGTVTPTPLLAPLRPRRVAELAWLGVAPQTIAALEPYVTLLPHADATPLNVNTAAPELIAAVIGIGVADAQRLVQVREAAPFRSDGALLPYLPPGTAAPQGVPGYRTSVKSDFFEVRSRLRLDQLVVEERAVLDRRDNKLRIVSRERGTLDPTTLSRIAMTQQR